MIAQRNVSRTSFQHSGYRWAAIAGATVAAAVLAGCGGGGSTTAAPTEAEDAAEFGLPGAEIERRQTKVESLILACMKGQGFDYVPVDPATLRAAMDSNGKPSGLSQVVPRIVTDDAVAARAFLMRPSDETDASRTRTEGIDVSPA